MYNYYQPQYSYSQQRPAYLKGRPVSSLEEARGTAIDFDGSIFYFPDLANNRIYTKQINFDGTASLNMFEMKQLPDEKPQQVPEYITRQEFEEALSKFTVQNQPQQKTNNNTVPATVF